LALAERLGDETLKEATAVKTSSKYAQPVPI
jgi:hypothetical protein